MPDVTIHPASARRWLEPIDRVSEGLFGLIMVLTFTCAMSAAEAGREDVRGMLIGAIGCNLAWGIIDAVMYLMGCLSERGEGIMTLAALRRAGGAARGAEEGQRIIADALPPVIASAFEPEELERARQRLLALPEPAPRKGARLGKEDWLGAIAVFLWVFLITFPVVIPFLFMSDAMRALRVSNIIAIALLFLTGYAFGRAAGLRPWVTGIVMVIIGCVLVAVAMALGG
jgi:VIT1/CCC1 family predicted Fe2+/Mn2+ transporter